MQQQSKDQQWQEALSGILQEFQQGTIPEAIALAMFPLVDIPSAKWSLLNRLLMLLAGTADARGIKQWNKVGRKVKKGAKAFRIFAPRIIRVKTQNPAEPLEDEDKGIQERQKVVGFLLIPVFRVEDTEGDPLTYEDLEVPDLPLMEVARAWGLEVKAIPGNTWFYGSFQASAGEISLASPEEKIFFHELSHGAHSRLGRLKESAPWQREMVAELSAAVLCRVCGRQSDENLGESFGYLERQAKKAGLTVTQACLGVLSEVEAVLSLVFSVARGQDLALAEEQWSKVA
jgi:hypothetical protein